MNNSNNPDTPMKSFKKAGEHAKVFNCSKSFIYHLAAAGRIPVVKIGGTRRFDVDAVLKHISEKAK